GFCHAWFGFWAVRGKGGQGFLPIPDGEGETLGAQARTAVIIPIYHETVSDVIHRVRCNYRSLEETGCLEHFDFFLLSDSQDPAIWSEEEVAWTRLCEELQASGKISYRRRKENLGKKAGNVADFCRRWGRQYAYMIVLDADSLLSGPTAVRMVKMMEAKPRAGLIQSVPRLCRATSLFGRMQQFSMRFYGKIFLAGLSYWQLHNGNYWGHNAIIRMEAFLKHCALPPLPGRKPFGGHILSHDFVEAALLRRAGYEVWLAPGLEDSYEEGPPTLQESAARDRRWCAGNLQHVLVLFAEGFKPASRVHLLGGVMGYLVSPLWLFFLLLSSIIAFQNSRLNLEPGTLPQASSLPFLGGVSCAVQGWWILGLTLAILFVPKCLAWVDLWFDSRRRNEFAGIIPSALSVIAESLFSMLMAPIIMLLHSR
ncbi:MAG: glucans biosynthesis glucosyltransferase MdoH, partial [Verrucomicrobiota bacterium]